jgi:4,5-DOPA dioxygenase extradiol
MSPRAPALFISHGAPTLALEENDYTAALDALGRSLGRPPAVVVVSAHWMADPIAVTASKKPATIHDFSGFGPELESITYACPGAPGLAGRIGELCGATLDRDRGLDHGVWVPLRHMFPDATIPVVQLSLPARAPADRFVALGRQLAPLRDEGVVVIGSGGIVHNLRRLEPDGSPPPDWARSFDAWAASRAHALDLPALMDFRRESTNSHLAAPTSEHFQPLLVVVGAALPGDRVEDVYAGFQYGTLSLRCLALRS